MSEPQRRKRVPTVISVEAPRWTSLIGVMTPEERKAALREVAARMRWATTTVHAGDCAPNCARVEETP